ncbi:MAG: TetR/AcrR family transcriptional regulator [Gaiellaceae bacterium]
MPRKYELKRRAEQQQQTRHRIVEAAIALHQSTGPARTTLSDVARRAGVQRHTLYRHFPDERTLLLACSGHYTAANPMPDPEPWLETRDPVERLRRGLTELYPFFEQTEPMLANVLRDAEVHALTREVMTARRGPEQQRIRTVLTKGVRGRRRLVVLHLALAFTTWRTLVRGAGLSNAQAVETMVRAFAAA